MKLMVCETNPFLEALEGLSHVLGQIHTYGRVAYTGSEYESIVADSKSITIRGLEPVYDEDSLEQKLRYMNSGRRFMGHVKSLARLVGAKVNKIDWNLFSMEVAHNKILVGQLGRWRSVVVAFQGPVEQGFIDMCRSLGPDFKDIEKIIIEDSFPGDRHAAEERADLQYVRELMTNDKPKLKFGYVCPAKLREHWDPNECTIEETKNGSFIVLDHSIQIVVYRGHTRNECEDFLF